MSKNIYNYCPHCGHNILKSNSILPNFCSYCGYELRKKRIPIQSNTQCTICHEAIDVQKSKAIKCSYCGSHYHEACVSSWLTTYNTCPTCLNVFIFPNSNLIIKKY